MIPAFAKEMIRRIDEDIETKKEQLALGQCASFEEYKNTCGQLRGLMVARQHIEATLQSFEDNDDV